MIRILFSKDVLFSKIIIWLPQCKPHDILFVCFPHSVQEKGMIRDMKITNVWLKGIEYIIKINENIKHI